jgi:hypothetical protein
MLWQLWEGNVLREKIISAFVPSNIHIFKTCKARFSPREERIKSYKIQQVTQKEKTT